MHRSSEDALRCLLFYMAHKKETAVLYLFREAIRPSSHTRVSIWLIYLRSATGILLLPNGDPVQLLSSLTDLRAATKQIMAVIRHLTTSTNVHRRYIYILLPSVKLRAMRTVVRGECSSVSFISRTSSNNTYVSCRHHLSDRD